MFVSDYSHRGQWITLIVSSKYESRYVDKSETILTSLRTVFDITDSSRIEEISTADDPPGYEAPPGYEEVVKLASPKKTRCFNRESRNGSPQNQ